MWKSKIITKMLEANLFGSDVAVFDGCTLDSRQVVEGNLFVAVQGEKVNGHSFIAQAFKAGATIVIGERNSLSDIDFPIIPSGKALITVENSLKALQSLAKAWCSELRPPVIGITGSSGKTTTKDMVATVLAQKYKVHCNKENFNNEIGLPLTILNAPKQTELMVLEMGMRGLGQIKELCDICKPSLGLITNIGTTHMELLGSQEKIAQAKWELIDSLGENGTAILNTEDFFSVQLANLSSLQKMFYGTTGKYTNPDVKGSNLEIYGKLGTTFEVCFQGTKETVDLPLPGEHNVLDALAALSVGLHYHIPLSLGAQALQELKLSKMRLDIYDGIFKSIIIDDAYNANPDSMKASLNVLAQRSGEKSIAVLGEMYELGDASISGHREVGLAVAKLGIKNLVTVGKMAEGIAQGAIDAGLSKYNINICSNHEQAFNETKRIIESMGSETWVLIKGSRGMKMENITQKLVLRKFEKDKTCKE